ncbi:MAG: NAD-dependent epimerase/dehydratase family protein [Erysipelotrichia bacterium]|nr:NAD-dependent epimerase/dehydratase family protein [Erysipelotrichia bacterium]
MKTVLVAGGAGFIGRHSLKPFIEAGYAVHSADLNLLDCFPDINQHKVDFFDQIAVRQLVSEIRPSHLLNFAWITRHGEYWTSPENFTSLKGGVNLLETFAEFGGQRVVMVGTCAEYSWKNGVCIEDQTRLEPSTVYGSCKLAMYEILKSYAKVKGLSWAWGRIFFTFGPYENPARFVPAIIKPLLQGQSAPCSHGNQIRDFLSSIDIGEALAALTMSEVQGAVNMASGQPINLRQIVGIIEDLIDAKGLTKFGEIKAPVDEPPILIASNQRLRYEVGWNAHHSVQQRLTGTINWWKKHV